MKQATIQITFEEEKAKALRRNQHRGVISLPAYRVL